MSRPKKGQKGDAEASKKWHETMIKKCGSERAVNEFFRTIGRKGGSVCTPKGFSMMDTEKLVEVSRRGAAGRWHK